MKNLYLIITLLFTSFINAQSSQIVPPKNIRTAFEKQYPNIVPSWSIEYSDNKSEDIKFVANFSTPEASKIMAIYDSHGNRKVCKTQILSNKLPVTSQKYLNKNYPSKTIRLVREIVDSKNVTNYEVEAKKGGKLYYVYFDKEGNFLNVIQIA